MFVNLLTGLFYANIRYIHLSEKTKKQIFSFKIQEITYNILWCSNKWSWLHVYCKLIVLVTNIYHNLTFSNDNQWIYLIYTLY
jgi:hypothetical protein